MNILMSRHAAGQFGHRINAVLNGRPHRLVDLETVAGTDGAYDVDVAFLTREVTGNSGKLELDPALQRFYDILRDSPNLQWFQTHAAGADRPIYAEMQAKGVVVTTGSGANALPVAQMAFAGLLALARKFPMLMEAQRRKSWDPLLGSKAPTDLKNQTVLVVGLGPIGHEIGRLCCALGMNVIGVRKSPSPWEFSSKTVTFENIDSVLPVADWLVLACPLTDLTRGILNADRIALLPRGAHVINVARGEVAVEEELLEGLRLGQLGGAFLDVFASEPLCMQSEFWELPNVIVSPHSAGHTSGHYVAVGEIFLDNLARWQRGTPLVNVVF